MRTNYSIVAAVAFGAALLAGRFGPELVRGTSVAHAHGLPSTTSANGPAVPENGAICAGGPEAKLKTQLRLTSITTTKAGSSPDIELEVQNRFGKDVLTASAVEVTDDRGKTVGQPTVLSSKALKNGASDSFHYSVPGGLAAGYYHVRVTTVAEPTDQSERETATDSFFFRVGSQGVVPVSHDEWHTHSNANLVSPKP